jgi:hypothetical protein
MKHTYFSILLLLVSSLPLLTSHNHPAKQRIARKQNKYRNFIVFNNFQEAHPHLTTSLDTKNNAYNPYLNEPRIKQITISEYTKGSTFVYSKLKSHKTMCPSARHTTKNAVNVITDYENDNFTDETPTMIYCYDIANNQVTTYDKEKMTWSVSSIRKN